MWNEREKIDKNSVLNSELTVRRSGVLKIDCRAGRHKKKCETSILSVLIYHNGKNHRVIGSENSENLTNVLHLMMSRFPEDSNQPLMSFEPKSRWKLEIQM